jgi:N-carbamoyl-L-amino-acid hydrolase
VSVKINPTRLRKNMEALAGFGRQNTGGICRESFSKADSAAKRWLMAQIETAGLLAAKDEADNVWGRLGTGGPFVVVGSHIDTVPEGGMFDGALGVLAALESLQTIREQNLSLKRPLEMVAFTDEEGAFSSFLGSRAVAGTLSSEELAEAKNMDGISLKQAMAASGLAIQNIEKAKRDVNDIEAYLELHIEQGPRLYVEKINIGIVRAIVGIVSYWITFLGEANHAGTTPMDLRRDALLGASEFCLRVRDWVSSCTAGVVTFGNMEVYPGAFNIVPGRVQMALEFRDSSSQQLEKMEASILETGRSIAKQRNLSFTAKRISWDAPVQLNQKIIKTLQQEADTLGYSYQLMDSGAGHDAQILAQTTRTGTIFIPSIEGKSHCPEEKSKWSDIERGAQLLLNCILKLAA